MTTLKAQLEGLNQALLGLDIRSQEVENIRQSLLQANQQALSMPLLNGKLEQINFDQIEKQLIPSNGYGQARCYDYGRR